MMVRPRIHNLVLAGVVVAVSALGLAACSSGVSQAAGQNTGTPTITQRTLIPGIAADRNVPEVQVTVMQGTSQATLDLNVAATEAERERGLMWITSMPSDSGMLFLFPQETDGGFWMENTYIPLDIAFFAPDGTLIAVKEGKPLDTTILSPGSQYGFVIEANAGWFAQHGFSAGARASLPQSLPVAS